MFASLIGIATLTAIATIVLGVFRVPNWAAPATAILRGTAQIAAVSVVLTGVVRDPLWVGVALLVMFCAAVATATSRLGWSVRRLTQVAGAMVLGAGTALMVVFVTGALALSARYTLAIGGIVIGNTMSIATLAGRRFTEALADRWEEVEGWLALGAPPRIATREPARASVYAALIPSIDQTRTTGLVTLPGAFVGAIFGGVSPLQAGRFQIVVLAAIIAAGAVTAVALTTTLATVRTKPAALR